MLRGWMTWREAELPRSAVLDRQARLRQAVVDAGLDAFLAYGHYGRPSCVSYLTGFTQYWADGVLLIAKSGPPAYYFTALSNRSNAWMRAVNPTAEIEHAPVAAAAARERLKTLGALRIGVCDLDYLPTSAADWLSAKSELVDATALFDRMRGQPDRAETHLSLHADRIAQAALVQVSALAERVGDVVAPAERLARLEGCDDCRLTVAPDLSQGAVLARFSPRTPLGGSFAVQSTVAYHGVWARRCDSFSRSADISTRFDGARQDVDAVCTAKSSGSASGLAAALSKRFPHGRLSEWRLEAPRGSDPLAPIPAEEEPPLQGVLTCKGHVNGSRWVFARRFAPTLEMT